MGPGAAAMVGLGLGAVLFTPGFFFLLLAGLSDPRAALSVVPLGVYLFAVAPAAIVVWLSAFVGGRPAARMVLFDGVLVAVAVAGCLGTAPYLFDGGIRTWVQMGVFLVGPALVATLPPALAWTVAGLADVRDARMEARRQAIVAALDAPVDLAAVGSRLGMAAAEVANVLDELLSDGVVSGSLDEDLGWFFSRAALHASQERLLALVAERGEVNLPDLARELGVPVRLVQRWVYELVYRGRFQGWINWKLGRLYSAAAGSLRGSSQCPNCAGALGLAAGGVVRCRQCGSDVFGGEA